MYVIRPTGIRGTPRAIATALQAETRKYPNPAHTRAFNYRRDFFMTNVSPNHVQESSVEYTQSHLFFSANKLGQRQRLANAGIPVPRTLGSPDVSVGPIEGLRYVVRPLRHSGGRDYRVADRPDFINGVEYASELYPKKREYRVIFVFGKPLIYMRKRPNEGIQNDAPWGHVNSVFQTINDVPSCKLSGTDCVTRLSEFPAVIGSHICAADILYNRDHAQPYVVLELNLCPSLQIEDNLNKVVEAIRAR